ncbi:hypothetical protein PVAP13_3NG193307 [Panicum virgatum]|uniref:Uncharacterized protein n=1 Tax=Panicum virgatum TaxID=38727 RepID=A0A8T0U7I7_PANVG|nr:hypothetical protein PVAP13_3NG193307 [Panicum virgatum]
MAGGDLASKPPPPTPPAGADEEGAVADKALHALGFEFTHISAREVAGRLPVTGTCCQPFGVLNGGVSSLVAESLASVGACMASGGRRWPACSCPSTTSAPPASATSSRRGPAPSSSAAASRSGRSRYDGQILPRENARTWCGQQELPCMLAANPSRPEEMTSHEASIKKYAKL